MSELAAARLAKELAQKTAQHENVVRDLSAAWSREAVLVARIAELEAALREIRDLPSDRQDECGMIAAKALGVG